MFLFKVFDIFTTKEKMICAFIVVMMLIGALLEALGIGAIMPLLAVMSDENYLQKHPDIANVAYSLGITTHRDFIMASTIMLILIYIIKNLYLIFQTRVQIYFALNKQISLSKKLLAFYLSKPYEFHLKNNSAVLIRNVCNFVEQVISSLLLSEFYLFAEIITALGIWGMLLWVDPITAIITAGLIGGLVAMTIYQMNREIKKQGIIRSEHSAELLKWLNQGLGSVKETTVMGKKSFFINRFCNAYDKYGQAHAKYQFLTQLPRMFIEILAVGGLLLLVVFKLSLGSNPAEIVPLLGAISLAAFRLMPSATRIISYSNNIQYFLPVLNMIYDDLRAAVNQKVNIDVDSHKKLAFQNKIAFQNLEFSYSGTDRKVLSGVSFEIKKGDFVGIIGQSGAGKTTFVDILLGLFCPTEGKILIDGIDVQSDIDGWRKNLAYVPQSIYLIDGSIKENIALGVDASDVDIELLNRVIGMAELTEFVNNLPDGIETSVGERGVMLSGGQRQRIGIARALYQQPDILILDEATSALDNDTEKSITSTILKLKRMMTIISIAHRLTTLEQCDYKVKFENGNASILY